MNSRSPTYSKRSARGRKKKRKLFPILILAFLFFAIIWKLILPQYELINYPIKFADEVSSAAKEFNLPEALIFAVIKTESSFDPNALSRANAKGLMQLTDDTNEWMALMLGEMTKSDQIYEPEMNIRRGCCLLSYLIKEFGSAETALAAYNAGIGRVRGWLEDPSYSLDGKTLYKIPIAETRNYVQKVIKAQNKYYEIHFSD